PHVRAVRRLLLRGRGGDDLRDRPRVRAEPVDERAARRGRLPERDESRCLVRRAAAGRVEEPGDRPQQEAGEREPPERDDGAAPAGEVDLALGVEFEGGHAVPTLAEAQAHCRSSPSSSDTRGCQPSARSRAVSAAVRRWSPATAGSCRTSRRRPEMRSRSAIDSFIEASRAPPRLYVPAGAPAARTTPSTTSPT